MIKVTCEVKIYGKDGEDCGSNNFTLDVKSHPISDEKVEIDIWEYKIIVVAADMIAAIENATNTKRF